MQAQLDEKDSKIKSLDDELKQRDLRIKHLNDKLKASKGPGEAEVVKLRQGMAELEKQITSLLDNGDHLTKTRDQAVEQVRQRDSEKKQLADELAKAREELLQLRGSQSDPAAEAAAARERDAQAAARERELERTYTAQLAAKTSEAEELTMRVQSLASQLVARDDHLREWENRFSEASEESSRTVHALEEEVASLKAAALGLKESGGQSQAEFQREHEAGLALQEQVNVLRHRASLRETQEREAEAEAQERAARERARDEQIARDMDELRLSHREAVRKVAAEMSEQAGLSLCPQLSLSLSPSSMFALN